MNRFPVGQEALTSVVHLQVTENPGRSTTAMPPSDLSCMWGYPGDPWGENATGMRWHSRAISPSESQLWIPAGERHTVNGTGLPLSRGVGLQPTSRTVHLSISPVLTSRTPSDTHRDPTVWGDFRSGNPQRSFVIHHTPHPPSPSLSFPQNSQPDLFPWVSKAHSVPEGHFVIAWNWNAKRLQTLAETRGWDSYGGDGELLCPRGGWAGAGRMPAWTCRKHSTCCQNLQHLSYPCAAS